MDSRAGEHRMLVISRKENESITIEPVEGLDPSLTIGELFARGPILVKIIQCGKRTRLAIGAPTTLKVMRVAAFNGSPDLRSSELAPTDRTRSQGL
jgi:sRNA-binding carbon storage regulator CsrA